MTFNELTQVLGPFAGANGRIDATIAAQLISGDYLFFESGHISSRGNHHILNGIQGNLDKLNELPDAVLENINVFASEVRYLIDFVEQDELLVLDKECVHYQFDKLNYISNGQIDSNIGLGLSGIRIFLLMAWHMICIDHSEDNSYDVIIDKNLYAGIPDANAYICQLIKRLREFNEISDGFEVTFFTCTNLDTPMSSSIDGANPIQSDSNAIMTSIYVPAKIDPYEYVQEEIAIAKANGIWQEWNRGHLPDNIPLI